jgi:hypothetical protein
MQDGAAQHGGIAHVVHQSALRVVRRRLRSTYR